MKRFLTVMKAATIRFGEARKGAAAVEFALIAPLLLALYFVTMEVSQGIETNKKVGRVSSMVADLVTQEQNHERAEIDAILSIGEAVLQPYNRTRGDIVVTAIRISDDATPKATVAWSRKLADGKFGVDQPADTAVTVPASLNIRDSFLIRVTAQLNYRPVITWTAEQKTAIGLAAAFDSINMSETYYLRPRMSKEIPCNGC